MVLVSNSGLSHQNQKRTLESGYHSSSLDQEPKFKTRKVSAVRDFPPGCGRNVIQADLASGKSVAADTGDSVDPGIREGSAEKFSDTLCKLQSLEAVNCPVSPEVNGSLDGLVADIVSSAANATLNRVEGVTSCVEPPPETDSLEGEHKSEGPMKESDQIMNQDFAKDLDEIVKLPIVENVCDEVVIHCASIGPFESGLLPKEEDNNRVEPIEDWNHMIQNHDLAQPVVESTVSHEVAVPASIGKTHKSSGVKEEEPSISIPSLIQKKYCTRRVSAVRDFPPFCGRNAPKPIEGNCEDIMKETITDKSRASIEKPSAHCGVESVAGGDIIVHPLEEEAVHNCILPNDGDDDTCGRIQGRDTISGSDDEEKCSHFDTNDQVVVQALMADPLSPSRKGGRGDSTGSDGMRKKGKEDKRFNKTNSSYRTKYGAVAKKSALNKATLFSIGAREGGPSSILVNNEESDAVQPFGGSGDSICGGDATVYSKVRKKFKAVSFKVGHKPDAYKKTCLLKKRPTSKIADIDECAFFDDGDLGGTSGFFAEEASTTYGHTLPEFDVTLPPSGPSGSKHGGDARARVRETLRLFQVLYRKVLQGEESKPKPDIKRIDIVAAKIIKEKGKEVNTGRLIIGEVPGAEVGDEFQYRVELALIGIHRLYQAGIDSTKHPTTGLLIAVSIVASGAYADEMDDPDVLVYSGQGGNVVGKVKTPEDQKLEKGNLALRNSISVKNPVRVVRGFKEVKPSESADARSKVAMTYVYDGLYTVANYWSEEGKHGKMVFMFELRRIPGQPELFWKEVKSSKKSTIRRGVCVDDITGGKEVLPICAINRIDSEKPPPFKYIRKMKYPEWFHPSPLKGCDCPGKCSDSKKCLCAVRNGGELPYNRNGAIVEVKPLVYECGPHCKCPPSCYNRVSQNGIKVQLEIFKTESRGWGVRSLTSIPSGTFICEYAGELLEDREAERRVGNDEYLFDIGHNIDSSSIQTSTNDNKVGEEVGYTIDAAEYGNVGRFINHSCSPNLYAQNVLFDYEDKRMPHIMLFAADNIPPLRELTYHYNYSVDQVHDSCGNIKVKKCFCGSAECSGRLY
ncbi:unnamed protein product [Cuscuta campestris]|uniref:Uncharacterized protein n=2 Tax=Cuscuta sect. Cleistogrammica TaxID=1824901 RepID=A0A484KKU5_9ASTE|nr:hypothetical protein DM860_015835 [Cuscuta australis]VFQ63739.1 unnamed protein product [Cuscuta campestris]